MGKGAQSQEARPPTDLANVNPDIGATAGQTRLIVDAVKETTIELKSDVKHQKEAISDIRGDIKFLKDHRFTDLLWHLGFSGVILVILAGMLIAAYFKIEERQNALATTLTRVETKLDDLIQRIPPVQTPPPTSIPSKK